MRKASLRNEVAPLPARCEGNHDAQSRVTPSARLYDFLVLSVDADDDDDGESVCALVISEPA